MHVLREEVSPKWSTSCRCIESLWCARFAFGCVGVSFLTTLLVCYVLWCVEGCLPWAPFISDFGIHGESRIVFSVGCFIGACSIFGVVCHCALARYRLIKALRLTHSMDWWNCLATVCGTGTAFCMAMVASHPSSEDLWLHFYWAVTLFFFGSLWGGVSVWLSRRFAEELCRSSSLPRFFSALEILVATALLLFGACFFFAYAGAGYDSTKVLKHQKQAVSLEVAQKDFPAYCRGEIGAHSNSWVNLAAFLESVAVIAMAGTFLAAESDVEAYFQIKGANGDQRVPLVPPPFDCT
eukprot:TRINITY_DN81757_c0_g1_i1.p1 TRINITY_DN81757_c0_g1~~TRINITY_DN81757_c0_g1_i1.p1  ORF type:complete len:295 (+),score=17.47 TRINITY_DN81757_c0_g1_i1:59-943(+)